MLVMCVIAAICVLGVVGALASTLSYDQLYGQDRGGRQLPPRSVRRRKSRRRSRQLQTVEAALATAETSRPDAGSTPHALANPKITKHERHLRRP
jgi:hypothetical protein